MKGKRGPQLSGSNHCNSLRYIMTLPAGVETVVPAGLEVLTPRRFSWQVQPSQFQTAGTACKLLCLDTGYCRGTDEHHPTFLLLLLAVIPYEYK